MEWQPTINTGLTTFRVNTSTIELAVTQVLFTDRNRPVERDLEDSLQRVYDADHVTVDFRDAVEAFYTINDYVMDKTHGRLGNVVTLDDLKEAQLMLISAIYFKGQWKVCILETTAESLITINVFALDAVQSKRHKIRDVL